MDTLQQLLLLAWELPGVKFIVSHTLLNVVVAVAAAAKTGTVELGKLGEFVGKKLLPYVALYYATVLLGDGAGLSGLSTVVFGVIEASLTGDLLDNLGLLGVKWPGVIDAVVTKDKGNCCH